MEKIRKGNISHKQYNKKRSGNQEILIPSKSQTIKMKKKSKKNNISLWIILLISMICIGIAIFFTIQWIASNQHTEEIAQKIIENTPIENVEDNTNTVIVNPPEKNVPNDYWDFIKMPLISVDFNELLAKNKDTVAWIHVNNTNINYPVVQTSNNSDYLNKAFDGTKTQAGWIFADYRNNMKIFDKNTIIYGHSRLDKSMFGSLTKTLNAQWYHNKENHIIKLSTPTENTMWQIFSIYKTGVESYYLQVNFPNDNEYVHFLNTLKSKSIYDFQTDLNANDKILTLSTCSDVAGTGRIAVHARLIKLENRI